MISASASNLLSHQHLVSQSFGTSVSISKADIEKSVLRSDSYNKVDGSFFIRMLNLCFMCLVIIGFGMCHSLFAPFFPTEAEKRGVSATVVGLIFGSYTFVMFVGSLISGPLMRELGLKFMIGAGTLISGVCTLLFGVLDLAPAGDSYVILCFAVRIVEGAGGALYIVAAFSIAAAMFPNRTASVYAALETAFGVGGMLGPSIGGAMFNLGGFSLPFYVVGGMLLVFGGSSMIVLFFTFHPDEEEHKSKPKEGNTTDISKNLTYFDYFRVSLDVWILTISVVIAAVVVGYPQPTLSLYFEELGLADAALVGLVFLGGSLGYTLLSVVIGKVSDSFPEKSYLIMLIGSLTYFLGYIFIGPIPPLQGAIPPSIGGTIASFVLVAISMAIVLIPAPALITKRALEIGFPEGLDTSTMVSSLYNGAWYLGTCAGAPIAGGLMDAIGFEWGGFTMAMMSAFMGVMILFAMFRNDVRRIYLSIRRPGYEEH